MNLLGIQILTAFICFLIFIVVGAVPFCIITCRLNRSSARNRRSHEKEDESGINMISLANCFACGIFLSACFIGLIPHVRHESLMLKSMILNNQNGSEGTRDGPVTLEQFVKEHETKSFAEKLIQLPDTELLVMIGFIFILILEQLVGFCQPGGAKKKKRDRSSQNGDSRWISNAEFEPLVSVNEEEEHDLMNRQGPSDLPDVGISRLPTYKSQRRTTKDFQFQEDIAENGGAKLFHPMNISDDDVHFHNKSKKKAAEAGDHGDEEEATKLNFQSIILLFGLGIHAIFEGLAIGLQNNQDSFVTILLAVMLHEVLCVFAFGLSLAKQRASLGYGFLSVVILSLSIPVGMFIGIPVPKTNSFSTTLTRYLLEGLASGIFVYVACVEMLAGELNSGGGHGHSHGGGHSHSQSGRSKACTNLVKVLTVSAGVIVFLVVVVLVP